jgi:predicted dehydrogenase
MTSPNRRRFLTTASTSFAAAHLSAAASTSLFAQQEQNAAPERIVVGVMGLSRGLDLAKDLLKMPNVVIKYACDTDEKRAASGVKRITEAGGAPKPIQDFREMLDDKEVDAFFCAAPNHWHGPAAILGTRAGKHVYVEKPACHNPQEGEWMIASAEKYNKCVQVGNQRRSSPGFQAAIQKVHSGAIGNVYLARSFFNRMRGSIGTKTDSPPPASLNYDLWQGPAPRREFRENVVHYNWHWFWHWGNGELGNNGVHALDICRWGLQVDYPIKTTSSGGRFCYKDDQETPDTQTAEWVFEGGKQITYQGLSCTQHPPGPFVSFYGSEGSIEINLEGGFQLFDSKNKLVEESPDSGWGQAEHIANFIEAARKNDPSGLKQPILSGHQSTLLCHLGNIAYRTGRVIHTSASNGRISDQDIPDGLWRRDYDPKWESEIVM